jgi:phenylacetate-CoA ligase
VRSGITRKIGALGTSLRHSRSTPERLQEYRGRNLRRIIHHAYTSVPLYQALWDSHRYSPLAVRAADDLINLPLVTRKDFRARPLRESLARGEDPARMITVHTTGSTGEPFVVCRTRAEDFIFHVFRMRAMTSFGLRPTDRMARIGTHPHEQSPFAWRAAQRLGLFRQAQIPLLDAPLKIASALREARPDVVTGNSGVLTRVAREITASPDGAPRPRFVVTSSEMLMPGMRRRISEGFLCPVYDTYCSEEFGLIAWECRKTGLYHVCDDNVVVEVLKDGRPAREGERGEIVVTALHYFGMPFVRYFLGDEGVAGPTLCPCGAPFSTLSEISGRRVDYLRLPDGRELYAAVAAHAIQAFAPWVEQYELVQERLDRIVIQMVAVPRPTPAAVSHLRSSLEDLLGREVDIRLEFVLEIAPGPGEKFRILRSLVDTGHNGF